jgi:hypothetical protein
MQLRDANGRTRIDEALRVVRDRIVPAFAGRLPVEFLAFGDRLTPADLHESRATASRSDAATAIRELPARVRGRTLAGVILVSDGAVTAPPPNTSSPVPVFAIGVGNEAIQRDREVVSATLGDPTVTGSIVDLAVTVVSYGFGALPFDVRLLEDGAPADVRRVASAADGTPIALTFRVSPRRDRPTVYGVEVPAAVDELTPDNNRMAVIAPPPGRPRRLIVLEGAPGFEHSFLKRAWDGDPGLRVDAAVHKGHNDQGQPTFYVQAAAERGGALIAGFPAKRAELFSYDAVVLANVGADALSGEQLEDLRAFVAERGGGLVAIGTRTFDPRALAGTALEAMIPLTLAGEGSADARADSRPDAAVFLTSEGERHPMMRLGTAGDARAAWEGMPTLASVVRMGGPRPGASVLAVGAAPGGVSRPIVSVQRYGRGRVVAFTGEASWRWKMMLPSPDRRYETFWRQAARWASSPAQDSVAVEASAVSRESATVAVTVRDASFVPLRDASIVLQVIGPDGRAVEEPAALTNPASGVYGTTFAFRGVGPHRISAIARHADQEIGRSDAWVLGGVNDPEMTDPRRHDDVLRRIAESSGGRLLSESELPALPRLLRSTHGAGSPVEERDLWHTPWVFLTLIGALCAEWTLRRHWGLR